MDIFLCYSSADKPAARKLYDRLSIYIGHRTWFEFGIHQNIEEVVENSYIVIMLLSQQSISQKGYQEDVYVRTLSCVKEIQEKGKRHIRILPLRLDACLVPDHLQYLPWTDFVSITAFEELINLLWVYQHEFKGPAIYAVDGRVASKDPQQFPVEGPAERYEQIDWYKYVEIPVTPKSNYSFLIRKHHVSNAQFLRFLRSDDYADKRYWTNFPRFDEKCIYIGDWGNAGLEWLKQTLRDSRSLLEKRMSWKWYLASGAGIPYDYKQPNHPAIHVTWFEANAYCKWLSQHWQQLPDADSISTQIPHGKVLNFRLPLERELQAALTYDDGTRVNIDPTGRRLSGLSIDISEKDMLANYYAATSNQALAYCDGFLYIDEAEREMSRLPTRGSFEANFDFLDYAFRMVVTDSQVTR